MCLTVDLMFTKNLQNPKLSNSYDFFIRGQEILSGAQRVHEPKLIEERAAAWGIDVETIASYVDSFRNGALPHGGGPVKYLDVSQATWGFFNIRLEVVLSVAMFTVTGFLLVNFAVIEFF